VGGVIDEETARLYAAVPGPLGEKLRAAMETDAEGDVCFALSGGRCPFLDGENLCEIHRQLGPEATSVTCRSHPRFIEDYGSSQEVTLCASCPAVLKLLLGSGAPLTFRNGDSGAGEPGDRGSRSGASAGPDAPGTGDRARPLRERLEGSCCWRWRPRALEEDRRRNWRRWRRDMGGARRPFRGSGIFPRALEVLSGLEVLDGDWRDLQRRAEAAEACPCRGAAGTGGAYFLFRYPLKAVNDGDLLGRVQLCVLMVLLARRLAAVCGLLRRCGG
jgi:lysine-N-methylase